jgi:hypothetical protein
MRRLQAAGRAAMAAAFSVLLPGMAPAQPAPMAAAASAQAPGDPAAGVEALRVSGRDVNRGVRKMLSELRWHRDLGGAASEARERQRPILWIQMLGDLRGFS